MQNIEELKEVELRNLWPNEEDSFTPWLADNLDYISDILEMDLELKQTEKPVGSYKADLVAQPTQGDLGDVVIENQLERSNHNHLGKIITYGAGLEASYVVWICENIREEHQTAIDWLNDNFPKDVGFLALEIKLYRIGDSEPAPKFEVVSKPDEWKSYVESAPELTETKRLQKDFWEGLKEYMREEGTPLSLRKAHPQHWYSFAVGKSGFKISLVADTVKNNVRCELYIQKKGSERIDALLENKEDIEGEYGAELEWQRLEDKEGARITQSKDFDIKNEEKWEEIYPWLKERAEKFYEVFSPRIQTL